MKQLWLVLLFANVAVGASDSLLKPEAQSRIRKNLQILGENTDRAKKNLAAAIHNIDVLNAELNELSRLEREHEALKTKYEGLDKKGANKEKVDSLLKGIQEGLTEIHSRRGPLQNQLKTWKERQSEYEAKVAEFEKKREELDAPPQILTPTED